MEILYIRNNDYYYYYEDHLLDEKKISEHFGGNFHEILHYPLNFTWQYHSPQEHFIDFKYFDMEWKDKL